MIKLKVTSRRISSLCAKRPIIGDRMTGITPPALTPGRPSRGVAVDLLQQLRQQHDGPEVEHVGGLIQRQPMVKLRDLNSDRSTIGLSSVSSQTIRKLIATTATMVRMIISLEENQSSSLPRSSITCRLPIPMISSAGPTPSIRRCSVLVSRLRRVCRVISTTATPMGTLIKKIHPQW